MATRQYIGARYVPKIFDNNGSNEWVSGIAYEPLTIVTYLNNSYTSKKPVPSSVGNPADNGTYWANTGNYTGVVSELTEKVDNLEDYCDELQEEINNLPNRRFWLVGDSFLTITSVHNWGYYFEQFTGRTDNVISGNSGGGFVSTGTLNKDFATMIHDETIPDDITDIIIIGGANDCVQSAQATLTTKINLAIGEAKTKVPNARIYIGFNGTYTGRYASQITNNFPYISTVYTVMNKVCSAQGVKFITSPIKNIMNNSLISDGVHPTDAGMMLFTQGILSGVFGHDEPINIDYQAQDIEWKVRNDNVYVRFVRGGSLYTTESTGAFPAGTATEMLSDRAYLFEPRSGRHFTFTVPVRFRENGVYAYDIATIHFDSAGKSYISPIKDHSGVTAIVVINDTTCVVPLFE